MESMHKCKKRKITMVDDASKRAVLSSFYYFECTSCKHRVYMVTSKKKNEGKPCLFDVNQRFAFAIYGELERGREALATICDILNMPYRGIPTFPRKHF